MSKLACKGGTPVAEHFLNGAELSTRPDLERKYLLEAYETGLWDDKPDAWTMVKQFEREWAEFNGSKFSALLTNGTQTLQVALEALGVGAGDEVIVPGLTWQATASAVCDVNAIPILVDVDPTTLCIDPKKIEEHITPRTRAIMPVHLYNRVADLEKIMRIARKHGLFVVEDCAHTHGSTYKGKAAGTFGNFGSFSFQNSKLMRSGEGGSLLMQDEDLFWKVASQRSCGREMKKGIRVHSGNYRLSCLQAALLRGQLAAMRKNAPLIDRNGTALDQAVADAPGVRPLRREKNITRQCGYGYAFLYDCEAYDGLPCQTFRDALSKELNFPFESTYEPLSHSDLYTPHTKPRHHLSRQYLKAITPSRWDLPVADDIWKNQAVKADWVIFACSPRRAKLLTDAVAKIYEHRHELIADCPARERRENAK